MSIKSLSKLFVGSALALAAAAGAAMATPTTLSFTVTGVGNYSVDTTDITLSTATKTIPTAEFIGGSGATPVAFVQAGLSDGLPVSFSTLTFSTVVGADVFTLSAGDEVFSFANISSAIKVASGVNTNGSISEQFNGTVTGDISVGQIFLGQSVSLSETCTQTKIGASISCSDSVITPGLPTVTPEPASLALLGAGVLGLGMARRRRH